MKNIGCHILNCWMMPLFLLLSIQAFTQPVFTLKLCSPVDSAEFDLNDIGLGNRFLCADASNDNVHFATDTTGSFVGITDVETSNYWSVRDTIFVFTSTDQACINPAPIWLSLELIVDPLPIVTIVDDTLCSGDSLTMFFGPDPGSTWEMFWSQASPITNAIAGDTVVALVGNIGATTAYSLDSVMNTGTGCVSAVPEMITVHSIPSVTLLTDTIMCPGDSLQLLFTPSDEGPWSLFWSDGATTQWPQAAIGDTVSSFATTAGVDTLLSISSGAQCAFNDTIMLHVLAGPSATLTAGACVGDTVALSDTLNLSTIGFANSAIVPLDLDMFVMPNDVINPPLLVVLGAPNGCMDTLTLQVDPEPSFDTITSIACEGDAIIVSGIANATTLTYEWANSQQSLELNVVNASASILSSNTSEGPLHLVLQGACSLDTLLSNIQVYPLPNAVIINNSNSLDGQVGYCVGQQLDLLSTNANAIWTAQDTAFLEPDMAIGASYDPMITNTGSYEIVLTVSRDSGGVVCTADTSLTVDASRSLCKISSLYQFPGYIFIAALDTTFNGDSPYFQWFNANDPLILDTLASVGNAAIAIIPASLADSVIRVFGSYYGEGLCECSSGRLNTKAIVDQVNELKVYPNPIEGGNFNMIMPSYFQDQRVQMQLIDPLGKSVLKLELEPGSIFRTIEIPVDLDGVHLMELRSSAQVVGHKVIVR